MAIGTFCRDSSRCRAVTTTSPTVVCAGAASAAVCALAAPAAAQAVNAAAPISNLSARREPLAQTRFSEEDECLFMACRFPF